ncbi:MAG: hypothetical protein MZV70_61445 [Desulfobacterales bacterium]|nr:hypothetical protein [Desulfobacterales bacterium]
MHALFVNDNSEMLEDTNRNGVMDGADLRVLVYYDKAVRDSKGLLREP